MIQLAEIRRNNNEIKYLRPDAKSQVTIEYDGYKPVSVSKVVIATQHEDLIEKFSSEEKEHSYIKEEVIKEIKIRIVKMQLKPVILNSSFIKIIIIRRRIICNKII